MKKISLVAVAFAAVVSAFAGALTESPRELPIEKEVDVLVLGGGSAALRPYVGDDVAGTLRIFEGRKLVPISHKRAARELVESALRSARRRVDAFKRIYHRDFIVSVALDDELFRPVEVSSREMAFA